MGSLNYINHIYTGSANRESLIDLEIPINYKGQLIIFVHGYMGFKDWGAWNLMQQFFTSRGFGFCKFNLSHNGGTVKNGFDFPDLNAFSENNYSKEKADVSFALDWIEKTLIPLPTIHLIGHSRGGGMVLLNALDQRVHSVCTLAAISSVAKRFSEPKILSDWEKEKVRYTINQRTKQQMPHNYSQVIDFLNHQSELDIRAHCEKIKKPILLIHGDKDVSVPIEEGFELADWCQCKLEIIENTDHVFGACHPWLENHLPAKLEEVCLKIEAFLS